ncbi:MAG: hypothetical protein E4H09_01105 [Spirochaetales bacterium]|nr:MAG: hypothetical protein E4H09_01105 [Spirochaetales bacterium]
MEEKRDQRRQTRRKRRTVRKSKRRFRAGQKTHRFLRATVGRTLGLMLRPVAENDEIFRDLKRPFLVLGNHISVWDPFVVNILIPEAIHYVVSDANFRSKFMEFGLGLVGSIPKTKAMSDLQTVKNIMKVRMADEVIGIFPEGQSSWDGHSLPLYYSTAKLAKLLKIPVVTANISGSYLAQARWARKRRKGPIRVRFDIAFTPEELREKTAEEIDAGIVSMLHHNEFEFNRKARFRYPGKALAEYAEIVLFTCPQCEAMSTMRSHDDRLSCSSCGYEVRYDEYGFFQPVTGDLKFDNIHDWHKWQEPLLYERLDRYVDGKDTAAFFSEEVTVEIGYKSMPLEAYRQGSIHFFADRIDISAKGHETESLSIGGIVGLNVQNKERLEFYHGEDLFRITAADPRACILKWDMAVRHLHDRQKPEEQPGA